VKATTVPKFWNGPWMVVVPVPPVFSSSPKLVKTVLPSLVSVLSLSASNVPSLIMLAPVRLPRSLPGFLVPLWLSGAV
jgi:hypothetical protein